MYFPWYINLELTTGLGSKFHKFFKTQTVWPISKVTPLPPKKMGAITELRMFAMYNKQGIPNHQTISYVML